jgi:hypothetical protein
MGLQMFVVQPSRLHVIVVQPSRLQCLWCGHRAAGVRSVAIGPQVFMVQPSRPHMQAGRLHHKSHRAAESRSVI